jgi:hypothetical protein
MRISTDINHPDYHPHYRRCQVFLAGAERCNVVFADEEGRHAVLHRLDENGAPVVRGGQFVFEHFWGAVRIECAKGVDLADKSGRLDYSRP